VNMNRQFFPRAAAPSHVLLAAGLLLLAGAGAAGAAAAPAPLAGVDPLSEPAPTLPRPLRTLAPPAMPPDGRIVASLWSRRLAAGPGERLRVVVLLAEPDVADLTAGLPDAAQAEAVRVQHVAALEHRFVADSQPVGFAAASGLSHFPVVFGEVEAGRLVALAALPWVRAVEEERVYHASDARGSALIKADQLRSQFSAAGAGIGVAVLDSGIDESHPEFTGRIVAQANAVGGTTGQDDFGHGTSVAGIIAGATQGIAPQAALWAIKVLDATGAGTTQQVLNGLNAVYASRNSFGGVRVVNMSFGGGGPFNSACDGLFPAEAQVASQMAAAGIALFAASGNDGFGNGVGVPACLSNVVSVGAVYAGNVGPRAYGPPASCTDSSTAADQITCYSNSGTPLAILAPSDCAMTAQLGGGFVSCFNGTSAATPYAAGVAALILSLRPAVTPGQLQQALMTTGRALTDVNGITRDRIDALAAYQALAGVATGACVRDAATACLVNGRFEVKVDYQSASSGSGSAQVMAFGGQRTENDQSVFWWFFAPTNFEMGVKVLDACVVNQRFWVFISGLTDQGWTVHVRDSQTGAAKAYSNPLGHLSTTFADISALPCS
jgi:subtilisin family serine protease